MFWKKPIRLSIQGFTNWLKCVEVVLEEECVAVGAVEMTIEEVVLVGTEIEEIAMDIVIKGSLKFLLSKSPLIKLDKLSILG